jgi:hypothetical protein
MLELRLDEGLLRFDGEVIEYFTENGKSHRYHVLYLKSIELVKGRKEMKLMDLHYGKGGGFRGSIIPSDQVSRAEEFIRTVMSAVSEAKSG